MSSLKQLSDQEKFKYQRAHLLLGQDLSKLFTYVEPADSNLVVYGHQIYQLYLRVCTEFEAVCKLSLYRTGMASTLTYTRKGKELPLPEIKWNIDVYKKLDMLDLQPREGCCSACNLDITRGRLSHFKFRFFNWDGNVTFHPLANFSNGNPIKFYKEYNAVKHNRETSFPNANLENVLNAYLALTAVLDWQGVEVNQSVISSCGNNYITGAHFGYFWVTSVEDPQIREKHYF
jgi:hypothetical protein